MYFHFVILERNEEENANKCESGKNTNDYAHAQNNLLEPSFTVPQMSKSTNEKTELSQRRTKRNEMKEKTFHSHTEAVEYFFSFSCFSFLENLCTENVSRFRLVSRDLFGCNLSAFVSLCSG